MSTSKTCGIIIQESHEFEAFLQEKLDTFKDTTISKRLIQNYTKQYNLIQYMI